MSETSDRDFVPSSPKAAEAGGESVGQPKIPFEAKHWSLLALCLIPAGFLCLSGAPERLPMVHLCMLAIGLLAIGIERVPRRPRASEILLLAAPAALCAFNLLHRNGFLFAVNQLAIPLLSAAALFSLAGIAEEPPLSCRAFVWTALESLRGLFCHWALPFRVLWRGVAAQNRAKIGVAFLSVVFCVPVLTLVVLLLADADAVFWETLTGLFSGEGPAWSHVLRVALTVVVALMFFSWLTVLRTPKRDRRASSTSLSIPAMFPAILLPMLNVVYALFTYIQFSNLFGGAAHAAMAGGYAEYARSGFFQLVLVAGINLIVLAVAIHASRGPWMRTMSALLIAATAVLLVSAFWRMRLYILAFGMTVLRALTLWGMIAIAALLIIAAIALFVRRFPAVSAALACLIVLWVGLNAVDLDARIVSYNVNAYLSGQLETIDADYLRTLNGGEEALSRLE